MRLTVMLLLLGANALAAPKLTWDYEGYSKLPEAAAEARRTKKRLLVGLAGSGT